MTGEAFVQALQDSSIQGANVGILQNYWELLVSMWQTGGVAGIVAFLLTVFLIKWAINNFTPVPSNFAWIISIILALATASFTVLFVYNFIQPFLGGFGIA